MTNEQIVVVTFRIKATNRDLIAKYAKLETRNNKSAFIDKVLDSALKARESKK